MARRKRRHPWLKIHLAGTPGMRWPLRHQILWPLVGSMLATLLAASALTAYLQVRQQEAAIADQLDAVSGTLRSSNFPLTPHVLQQMSGLSGAQFVLCDGPTVRLATPGVAAGIGGRFELNPLDSRSGRLGPPTLVAGEPYFHRAVNVLNRAAASPGSTLHVLYPERSWREARRKATTPTLAVGALAVLLGIGLATALARRWSRPIARLRRQLAEMANGDYQDIVLPERNDELRDLTISANALATQLSHLTAVVRRSERLAVLGQLSGGMAHDLRNTVTGARMALQLHERRCAADDESLEVALRQMGLIEEYLRRFLTVGKPELPQRASVAFPELIAESVKLLEPACRHRRVRMDVVLPDATPRLWADAGQLRQLLLNLLLNALEAAGPGGWVRIELSTRPGGVLLRIVDSGPGVDAAIRDHLFEPFATTKPEGLGLGLSVVRQVVEAHGGVIACVEYSDGRVEPGEPGGRTAFEVQLPLGERDDADQATHDAAVHAERETSLTNTTATLATSASAAEAVTT